MVEGRKTSSKLSCSQSWAFGYICHKNLSMKTDLFIVKIMGWSSVELSEQLPPLAVGD